jgi:hypothetical protein
VQLDLSLVGQGIETGQESVDLSRVAHDQWSVAGTQQKASKLMPIGGARCEIADPPKAVVGTTPDQVALEPPRKGRNHQRARDGDAAAQDPFGGIPTLPQIRAGSPGGDKPQDNIPDARQEVHVVMSVDEIRGSAPDLLEGIELMLEFGPNFRKVELAEKCSDRQITKPRQTAIGRQTSGAGKRSERGQGEVQADIRSFSEWL